MKVVVVRQRQSSLWYWLLVIFPALGVLLAVQQTAAISTLILVLVLATLDVGTRKDVRWDQVLGGFLVVAAVVSCIYRGISMRWMYPPMEATEPGGALLAFHQTMMVADRQTQTTFAIVSALFFAVSQPHRQLLRMVAGSAILVLFVYPVFGYWVWGSDSSTFEDFAGGSVIYGVAGWFAVGSSLANRIRHSVQDDLRPVDRQRWLYLIGILGIWLLNVGLEYFLTVVRGMPTDNFAAFTVVSANLTMFAAAVSCVSLGRLAENRWQAKHLAAGIVAGFSSCASTVDWLSGGTALLLGSIAGIMGALVLQLFRRLAAADHTGVMTGLAVGSVVGATFRGFLPEATVMQQLAGVAFCIAMTATVGFAFEWFATWVERFAGRATS